MKAVLGQGKEKPCSEETGKASSSASSAVKSSSAAAAETKDGDKETKGGKPKAASKAQQSKEIKKLLQPKKA